VAAPPIYYEHDHAAAELGPRSTKDQELAVFSCAKFAGAGVLLEQQQTETENGDLDWEPAATRLVVMEGYVGQRLPIARRSLPMTTGVLSQIAGVSVYSAGSAELAVKEVASAPRMDKKWNREYD
jgi:hypothetical protein